MRRSVKNCVISDLDLGKILSMFLNENDKCYVSAEVFLIVNAFQAHCINYLNYEENNVIHSSIRFRKTYEQHIAI
jgi:hypothetical protein